MKVLALIDALSFGGAENTLVTFAEHAQEVGVELEVAVLSPPLPHKSQWLRRFQTAGLEPRFLGVRKLLQPDAVLRVRRAIRESGCDLVHAHLGYACTLGPVAAALAGVPAVCTLHHTPVPLGRRDAVRERLSVEIASRSRGVVFVSEASRRGFAAAYRDRPRSWTVLPNGVDLERFHADRSPAEGATARARLGVPDGALLVSLVGHMRPGKGQDVAVAAWPDVLRHHPDAYLVLVGNGPDEHALRAGVDGLGIASRVVFAGARDDVDVILRCSSLAVLPSSGEALPTALIEASASGVPVVATRVGGVPEVVLDGRTGWLVDRPDPGLVAAAVVRALSDPQARAVAGAEGQRWARARFGAAAWATSLADLYDEVLAGGRAGTRPGRPVRTAPGG